MKYTNSQFADALRMHRSDWRLKSEKVAGFAESVDHNLKIATSIKDPMASKYFETQRVALAAEVRAFNDAVNDFEKIYLRATESELARDAARAAVERGTRNGEEALAVSAAHVVAAASHAADLTELGELLDRANLACRAVTAKGFPAETLAVEAEVFSRELFSTSENRRYISTEGREQSFFVPFGSSPVQAVAWMGSQMGAAVPSALRPWLNFVEALVGREFDRMSKIVAAEERDYLKGGSYYRVDRTRRYLPTRADLDAVFIAMRQGYEAATNAKKEQLAALELEIKLAGKVA